MKIQWFGLCFCLLVFSCGEVGGSQGEKSVVIKEEKTEFKQKKIVPEIEEKVNKIESQKKEITNEKDTISPTRTKVIERLVNGRKVEITLDGSFQTKIEFEGHEYPLKIKEVYPGIVYFDKYHNDKRYEDSISVEFPVKDKIEFHTQQKLIKTFIIDEHNPYLKASQGIKIRQNYSDAEGTYYIPKSKRKDKGPVVEYHLNTGVQNQESFSKVIYSKYEINKTGGIIGNASTMVVLNAKGNEIFNHEYKGACGFLTVSHDGRYVLFAILPVETTNNAGIKTQLEGFEIWDIQNKKLLHREENNDPNMWMGGIESKENCLRIEYTYPNSDEYDSYQVLFVPQELKLYSKKFSKKEWKEARKIYKEINGDLLKLRDYFKFEKKNISYE